MSPQLFTVPPGPTRRSADAEVRAVVAQFAPKHQRLVSVVRRWLKTRLPTAHEVVYAYRDSFVISYAPTARGYEGPCAIRGSADEVRLYLNRGKGLKDPAKLLRGTAQARWIVVEDASTLARPEVIQLVDLAIGD